jgi:uncharacterized protein (TIGR02466 family)
VQIEREPDKTISLAQETAFIRAAYARAPTPMLRTKLASLILQNDEFEAAMDVLAEADEADPVETHLHAMAIMSRDTPAAYAEACTLANRALALAHSDNQRAAILATRGKAEAKQGDSTAALRSFTEALRLAPANKDALKRLAALHLADGRPDAVTALANDLLAKGIANSRLFAAAGLAEVMRGDDAAGRRLLCDEALMQQHVLPPPPGWDSLDAFNAALAEELEHHPGLRFDRYGSASNFTWRVEYPAVREAPLSGLLVQHIIATLDAHITALAASDHPWARAQSDRAWLRTWSVITEGDGYEGWHIHQFGWLSGVYYVKVPDAISAGEDEAGCLAFGVPADFVGEEASTRFGTRLVRPEAGMMLTFPSHSYHRTFPHGGSGKRICFAFDLRTD